MSEPQPWYGHPVEPTRVAIGDVGVGPTTVTTPSGSAPVAQTSFQFADLSQTRENIPTVCAVVFFVLTVGLPAARRLPCWYGAFALPVRSGGSRVGGARWVG